MTKAAKDARVATVDRYGKLEAELGRHARKVAKKEAELKALEAEILAWANDEPAADAVTYEGKAFVAVCSPRRNVRALDVQKFRKAVGDERFFAIATVGLADVDSVAKLVPEALKAVTQARTGKRSLSVSAA